MIQYIINASAIWLLSLIVFDIFLSKESFHSYNRFYLLSTFILGLTIPLLSLQDTAIAYSANIGEPVAQGASVIKDGIVTSKAAITVLSMHTILTAIYLTGAAVFMLLVIKEAAVLVVTYKRGDKFKDGVWTVVETGKQHSPYSAFRYVYISSKKDYTDEQLRIILMHEEQHGHQLHFIDLLFMQLAKIVFWFHPLVYMYAERLCIVHEYQADAAVDKAPKEYGHFLIEQAILKSAPNLTHSFNRSPIKKRILMLTQHSSNASKSKMALALPLVAICMLCFSKDAFSDDKRVRDGNKITYRGNIIEMSPEGAPDTTMVVDPSTGKQTIRISRKEPSPALLNGKNIYTAYTIEGMARKSNKIGDNSNNTSGYTDKGIKEYLLTNLKEELKQIPDGNYYLGIDNVIIDAKGAIAYYEYSGISMGSRMQPMEQNKNITKEQQDKIAKKIARLTQSAPKHLAATVDGNYVPSIVDNSDFWNSFTVKGGKLTAL